MARRKIRKRRARKYTRKARTFKRRRFMKKRFRRNTMGRSTRADNYITKTFPSHESRPIEPGGAANKMSFDFDMQGALGFNAVANEYRFFKVLKRTITVGYSIASNKALQIWYNQNPVASNEGDRGVIYDLPDGGTTAGGLAGSYGIAMSQQNPKSFSMWGRVTRTWKPVLTRRDTFVHLNVPGTFVLVENSVPAPWMRCPDVPTDPVSEVEFRGPNVYLPGLELQAITGIDATNLGINVYARTVIAFKGRRSSVGV